MSSQPHEKEQTIIAILDQLRPFSPAIGSYIKSIYTDDFDYSVKFSNGRIRLPEELITDFEQSPAQVPHDRYRQIADRFVPNSPPVTVPAVPENPVPLTVKKASSSRSWKTMAIVVILLVIGYLWIQSSNKDHIKNMARLDINSQVKVEGGTYMVDRLFGGISDLRVTVTNNSDYLVDIVKVKVSYIKSNGELYKDEMLYFNQLNPHSTQTLDAPKSNRGTKVSISRESLTCAALDIN